MDILHAHVAPLMGPFSLEASEQSHSPADFLPQVHVASVAQIQPPLRPQHESKYSVSRRSARRTGVVFDTDRVQRLSE